MLVIDLVNLGKVNGTKGGKFEVQIIVIETVENFLVLLDELRAMGKSVCTIESTHLQHNLF